MRRLDDALSRGGAAVGLLSAAVLASCGQDLDHPAGSTLIAPIIDGVLDDEHRQVGVLLLDFDGVTARDFCSATLVGRRHVLTAAHCVEQQLASRMRFASSVTDPLQRISALFVHPARAQQGASVDNDIALVKLREPLDRAPVRLATFAPTVGMGVTLVGFGDQNLIVDDAGGVLPDATSAGLRRAGTGSVSATGDRHFEVLGRDGNACAGDSGGPVFARVDGVELQIGVISSASATFELSAHVTVAAYADWLRSVAIDDLLFDTSVAPGTVSAGPVNSDGATLQGGCTVGAARPGAWSIPALWLLHLLLAYRLDQRRGARSSSAVGLGSTLPIATTRGGHSAGRGDD